MKSLWRNSFVLSFLLALSVWAQAETLETHLEKIKSVIAKDGRCDFATVDVPTGRFKGMLRWWPKTVSCIGDVVMAEGTMNERSGCAYFTFDPYSGNTNSGRFGKIAEGKLCANGGLEEVMSMSAAAYVLPDFKPDPSGISKFEIGWNFYGSIEFLEPIIIYNKSNSSTYDNWFKKKRIEWLAKENEREKKEKLDAQKEKQRQLAEEKHEQKNQALKKKKKNEVEALWKD